MVQLCKDYESNYAEVNKQLDKMGYNIGLRLIEEFLAKSSAPACSNFREVAEMISKVGHHVGGFVSKSRDAQHRQVGFKMFLNIIPTITNWSSDNKQFSLLFDENPLADFVELPDDGRAQDELWFSNILVGVLRGALEMVIFSMPKQAREEIGLTRLLPSTGSYAGRGPLHQRCSARQ